VKDPLRLSLLPLAIAAIVFLTAVPVELRHGVWQNEPFRSGDFLANVALYLPLGFALRRHRFATMLIVGLALSAAVELSQIWMFGRFSSLFDCGANTLGTVLGQTLARALAARTTSTFETLAVRRLAIPALAAAVAVPAVTLPTAPSHLLNWKPEFALSLGNEQTGDRPWHGTIAELVLVPAAISVQAARQLGNTPIESFDSRFGGAEVVVPVAASITLTGGPPVQIARDVAERFAREAMARNAFSVIARVESAAVDQFGPARIITFSANPFNRNFDLGQEGSRVIFRVRTPTAGPDANYWRAETSAVLEGGREYLLTAIYDGEIARIFVDGSLYGRANLVAGGCLSPVFCDTGSPFARALFGASFTLVVLAVAASRRRRTTVVVGLAAAMTSALLDLVLRWGFAAAAIPGWPAVWELAGGLCVVMAIRNSDTKPELR
jgi:VanZ family protein